VAKYKKIANASLFLLVLLLMLPFTFTFLKRPALRNRAFFGCVDTVYQLQAARRLFKAITVDIIQLDKILTKIFGLSLRFLGPPRMGAGVKSCSIVSWVVVWISTITAICLIVWLWKRQKSHRSLILVFCLSLLGLTAMLTIASFYLNISESPYYHQRYYWSLQPFFLIVLFSALVFIVESIRPQRWHKPVVVVFLSLLFVVLMLAAFGYTRFMVSRRYATDLHNLAIKTENSIIKTGKKRTA